MTTTILIDLGKVEVLYTGGCSSEHLIGSTDEKGLWLDGHLLRRLRILVEGARGTAKMAVTGRHRARGVGTGDVCPQPSGNATCGFSHGCKSRLLLLDGPVSRLLEGILAGDPASGLSLTGLKVRVHSFFANISAGTIASRCKDLICRIDACAFRGGNPSKGVVTDNIQVPSLV